MKHKLLATLMFAAALSQIACDKSSSEKASDCLSDPICKQQVAMASGPQLIPLGVASAQVPVAPGTNPLLAQPFRVASVANAAIKAQSAKVAAQIQADDNNPLSTYYKAPTPDIPAVKSTASAAPAMATRSAASIEPIAQGSSGADTGEAAR